MSAPTATTLTQLANGGRFRISPDQFHRLDPQSVRSSLQADCRHLSPAPRLSEEGTTEAQQPSASLEPDALGFCHPRSVPTTARRQAVVIFPSSAFLSTAGFTLASGESSNSTGEAA